MNRHQNGSEGLLEAREVGGSPRPDSKSPGADGERSGANKLGCGGLRKEPSERARGWGTSAGYGRIQGGIRVRSKGWGRWKETG